MFTPTDNRYERDTTARIECQQEHYRRETFDYDHNDDDMVSRMAWFIRPLVMVLLVVTILISYAVSQAAASRFQRAQVSPAKAKEAKRLFKQRCAKCHGQDGAGNNYGQIIGATNLTDPEWQERADDKRIINSIKHGRGQMPALGEKLTDEQITALMLHVRTLKK